MDCTYSINPQYVSYLVQATSLIDFWKFMSNTLDVKNTREENLHEVKERVLSHREVFIHKEPDHICKVIASMEANPLYSAIHD
jgi:hypothetical protein